MPNGEEKKENKLEAFEVAEQSKSLKDERKRNENKASRILICEFDTIDRRFSSGFVFGVRT